MIENPNAAQSDTVVAEFAATYEQEHGRRPTARSLQIATHILKVGKMLTDQGQKDAQQGKKACPAEAFHSLVIKAFRLDPDEDQETVQTVADLWQSDYMDGYKEGCAV